MVDPTPNEKAALAAAGDYAAQYLEYIGKTDLAAMDRDEWLTFVEAVVTGYRDSLTDMYSADGANLNRARDGVPF